MLQFAVSFKQPWTLYPSFQTLRTRVHAGYVWSARPKQHLVHWIQPIIIGQFARIKLLFKTLPYFERNTHPSSTLLTQKHPPFLLSIWVPLQEFLVFNFFHTSLASQGLCGKKKSKLYLQVLHWFLDDQVGLAYPEKQKCIDKTHIW